ncbi:twin-arginine translocase subunit TatC [Haladaptatus sp. NG-WS-4]
MGEESEATAGDNLSKASTSEEAPEPPEEEELYTPEDPEPPVEQPSQPVSDEEMPLADHIEEMIKRLAVVLIIAGVVSVVVLPLSDTVINFLWNSILPVGPETRPRLYHPLALVMTELKVASLAGVIVALPVMVYETYLFMRPGLYPHERRYYLAAVPTSLVLALVGVSFAYFLILPAIFTYFLSYTQEANVLVAFGLTKTFNLILMMMGVLAVVFQIPLLIMLAIMMGLTTRRWLASRRLYFWGGFLGFAFLFSPDPTGMAPFLVALTMVGLFEGTLLLLKWTGR